MVQLPQWLDNAGDTADFTHWLGLIERLGEVGAMWKDIGTQLLDLGKTAPLDTPERVIGFVLDNIGDPAVAQVFTALNASAVFGRLQQEAAAIKASQWSKLAYPLSASLESYTAQGDPDDRFAIDEGTNKGLISLGTPKLAWSGQGTASSVGLEFAVSGEAALEAEGGAVWPFAADKVEPGLVRVGARGAFSSKGGLSVPFEGLGKASGTAGITTAGGFSFYFRPESAAEVFAAALLPALPALPNPLDLQAISNAMALRGLEGLTLTFDGAAEGGLELELGRGIALPGVGAGQIALAATLAFKRASQWILSLRRERTGRLRFALSRARKSEHDWSIGINLEVGVGELAQRVSALLEKAEKFSSAWLLRIEPFLTPGTYVLQSLPGELQQAADALIADPELRAAVVKDAKLLLGADGDGKLAVESWLKERISASVANVGEGVFADADTFVEQILGDLEAQLPGFAADRLATPARNTVEALVARLKGGFDVIVGQITSSQTNAGALADELRTIGVAVTSSGNDADDALKGVRELVERYQSFLADLVERARTAAQEDLKASFGISGASSSGAHYELFGTINKVDLQTIELWRSLVLGKLEPFQRLLAEGTDESSPITLNEGSSMARFARSSRGLAAAFFGLGVEVSYTAIAAGEAEVVLTADGIVARAKATATKTGSFFGPERVVSFISAAQIARFKQAQRPDERKLSAEVSLSRSDENLKLQELKSFLVRLEDSRLISAQRRLKAEETYQEWFVADPAARLAADVAVKLVLPGPAVENMLALGRAARGDAEFALFKLATQVQLDTGVVTQAEFDADSATARRKGFHDDPYRAFFALGDWSTLTASGPRAGPVPVGFTAFAKMRFPSTSFAPLLRTMADIYDATPRLDGSAGEGWDEKRFRDEELKLASKALSWIKLKDGFTGRMHPVTVAFLRVLANMDRGPVLSGDPAKLAEEIAALTQPAGDSNALIRITMQKKGNLPVII